MKKNSLLKKIGFWLKNNFINLVFVNGFLLLMALFPLIINLVVQFRMEDTFKERDKYQALVYIMPYLIMVLLCALFLYMFMYFGYLFSTTKINFYHSLPIKRGYILRSNTLTIIIFNIVISFAFLIILFFIFMSLGADSSIIFNYLLYFFVTANISFIAIYSIALFLFLLSNSLYKFFILILLVSVFFPLLGFILNLKSDNIINNLTPFYFVSYLYKIIPSSTYTKINVLKNYFFDMKNLKFYILCAIIFVIFYTLSYLFFINKKLENADKA